MADIIGTMPTHVERIKPQISVDPNGNITWLPGLNDYDASLFYRGKTVTNDEFNTLFLRSVYQGNYLSDSLAELFQKHLGTAIYRSFTTDFKLVPSYIKSFTSADWGTVQEDGYYYITIPASEHGFEADEQITPLDRMNIDTEMYLLGPDGRFYEVTQIDTDPDNTVRLYTDDNTLSGFVVVRTNDKAYALAATETIEASQVRGLADVATSAKYTDLVDINSATGPNTRIAANLAAINAIVGGDTVVAEATHSETADSATRVPASGYLQNILVSSIFETNSRYVKDATRARDYDTETGSIKTKFDSVTDTFAQLTQDIANTYYKKIDTVDNSKKINNLEITQDTNGILRIGDIVIPQKHLLYENTSGITLESGTAITLNEDVNFGDVLEFETDFGNAKVRITNGLSDYYIGFQMTLDMDNEVILWQLNGAFNIDIPRYTGDTGTKRILTGSTGSGAGVPINTVAVLYVPKSATGAYDTRAAVKGMSTTSTNSGFNIYRIYKVIE